MPKISIVIPVYNAEKHLAQCLESIINQTYKNLEILIIDDGSTDNSSAIYQKYASQDKRIKIIRCKNSGTVAARNKGLKKASGTHIHFMDNDDYLEEKNFYEMMLKTSCATKADVVCSGVDHERAKRKTYYTQQQTINELNDKLDIVSYKGCWEIWKYLYKKSFLSKYKLSFEKKAFPADDMLLSVQTAYYANKIILVPRTTYHYRKTAGSALKNKTLLKQRRLGINYAWQKVRQFAREKNFDYEFIQEKILRFYFIKLLLISKKNYKNKAKYYLFGFLPLFRKKFNIKIQSSII